MSDVQAGHSLSPAVQRGNDSLLHLPMNTGAFVSVYAQVRTPALKRPPAGWVQDITEMGRSLTPRVPGSGIALLLQCHY